MDKIPSLDEARAMITPYAEQLLQQAKEQPYLTAALVIVVGNVLLALQAAVRSVYLHPLSRFPGPKLAAITTYRKAFIELVLARSWHLELQSLHKKYGPVVRVGPNELHFSDPQAYLDIYNASNRWDKEQSLYHSFGEDESSFGYLDYKTSKERKTILNKSFSATAIAGSTGLVQEKVDALCRKFSELAASKSPADLNWAFRCMTMDIITYMCFGKSADAIDAPGFAAPILVAMDASLPVFVAFKHSSAYKNMIIKCPPKLSKVLSPPTAGLVDLQQLLTAQLNELVDDPSKIDKLPHGMTIYHALMGKEMSQTGQVPSTKSLYEEGQALMFAGADTVGNTLMVAIFHILKDASVRSKLKQELQTAWPSLQGPAPSVRIVEKLPYLNACIKEALRLNSGVISGLPRIVPATGAEIADQDVPGSTVVSIGSTFVHYDADIFPRPLTFDPERWLGPDAKSLEQYLVAFSRGPRSCLGINLAWVELRLALAAVVRRFDFTIDAAKSPETLQFRECFLPDYGSKHLMVHVKQASA